MPKFTRKKPLIQLPPDLMQAFLDSQSYDELHGLTEAGLSKWFHADHVALCLMNPELPTGFLWKARTTERFLQSYHEWYADDFVYQHLSRNPDSAFSDVEMLRGGKVENTPTHDRSLGSGLRLRRVLAGLIDIKYQSSMGAIALYSEGSKPFSEERRRLLQDLIPYLRSAFRNILRFDGMTSHNKLLEAMLQQAKVAALVLDAQGREVLRTGPVTTLMENWFPSRSDRDALGVPREWRERMATLMKGDGVFVPGTNTWRLDREEVRVLNVCFAKLPRSGGRDLWELQLKESILIPTEWSLTPAQIKVALLLLQGLENQEIAKRLNVSETTVRTHLKVIFKKLGVSHRGELAYLALRP